MLSHRLHRLTALLKREPSAMHTAVFLSAQMGLGHNH